MALLLNHIKHVQLYVRNINTSYIRTYLTKGMIINSEMRIVAAGNNLIESWSTNNDNQHPNELIGSKITKYFKLRRPTGIVFDFTNVRDVSLHRRGFILICHSSFSFRSQRCKLFYSKFN